MDIASGRVAAHFQDVDSDHRELSDLDLDTLANALLFTGVARQRLREWL